MANLVFGVATGVVSARGLEPYERGVYVAVILWASTIASVSLFGSQQSVIFHARGSWSDAISQARMLWHAGRRRMNLLTATTAAISWYLSWDHPHVVWIGLVAAAVIPLNAATQLVISALLASDDIAAWNLIRLSPACTYAVLSLVLIATGAFSVLTGLVAWLAGNAAAALLALSAGRHRSINRQTSTVHASDLRSYGRRSFYASLPYLLASRVDQLVLASFADPAILGVYAVAVSVAAVADVAAVTVNQLAFPRFMADAEALGRSRVLAISGIGVTCIVVMPIVLIGKPLISAVYGAAYTAASAPLAILLFGAAIRVGIAFLTAAAQAMDELRVLGLAQGLSLAVTSLLVVGLLTPFGMVGAAAAVALGQLICLSMLWFGLGRVVVDR